MTQMLDRDQFPATPVRELPPPELEPGTLTIAVVGLGYVGLPTALAYTAAGVRVVGYDISAARRDAIRHGRVDLLPQDTQRLAALSGSDDLVVTEDPRMLADANAVLICVPTPVDAHLVPDLTALRAACRTVAEHARPGQVLVLTSTSFVGTTRELLVEPLAERGLVAGEDIHVAYSPERIDPGNRDFPVELTPRVLGGASEQCAQVARLVLEMTAPAVHVVSSLEAAELTKLHENTFRAVNIAYANEMADICAQLGLDVAEVIDAAASKPYGFMAFRPGPGVGGHCIPCDPHYLLWQLRAARTEAPLVDAAMRGIAARPHRVVSRVRELLGDAGRTVHGARVLVLGVAYKPGVADVRESPALEIIQGLSACGASVSFSDPFVDSLDVEGRQLSSVVEPSAEEWDLVVVHTLHPGVDLDWLGCRQAFLDTTYRLPDLPGRSTL